MPSVRRTILPIAESPRIVFLVALTIRVWVLAQLLPQRAWDYFYRYNEPSRIAWALVSGFGYSSPWPNTPLAPTAQQPPLYPLLVASIFRVTGAYSYRSLLIAVGLNAALSSLTAVMILRLGKRDFGSLAGVLAAWVWACWMYEAAVAIQLWGSGVSALLLVVALWLLPGVAGSRQLSRWLIFGVLAGAAALNNPALLAVFLFFWVWLGASQQKRDQSTRILLIASVGIFLLVLLPWTIRNYQVFHRVIPLRDNFGAELWFGNHEGATRRYDRDFPIADPSDFNRQGEIGFMESKRDIALQFIGQHPAEFLRLSAWRCLWYWTTPDPVVWSIVSLMGWIGMFLALRRKGLEAIPYAVVLLVFPLVYYVTHSFPTYRHPTEPVMFLLAAYTIVSLAKTISRWFGQTAS
jgi:hypothetical protein